MFPDDEVHELGHERRVSGPSVGITEIHDEQEMKVSVKGVSRDTGNEPMPRK